MQACIRPAVSIAILALVAAMISLISIPQDTWAAAYTAPASNRVDLKLSSDWKYHQGDLADAEKTSLEDSNWLSLDLPHTWNNLDGQDGGGNRDASAPWVNLGMTALLKTAASTLLIASVPIFSMFIE